MIRCTVLMSVLLATAMATSDPEMAMCGNRCSEWDALQTKCEVDRGCWNLSNGSYDHKVRECLNKCFHVASPCYNTCSRVYNTCQEKCPQGQVPDCFFSCYETLFEQMKPPLPGTEE